MPNIFADIKNVVDAPKDGNIFEAITPAQDNLFEGIKAPNLFEDIKPTTQVNIFEDVERLEDREFKIGVFKPEEALQLTPQERKERERIHQLRRDVRLVKQFPRDIYSGTSHLMDAFAQGILPLQGERLDLMAAHPVATGAGALTGLIATTALTGGIAPAVSNARIMQAMPTVARIAAGRMAQVGTTFGLKEFANNMAEIIGGDKKSAGEVATSTLESTAFGVGLGAIGVIPEPLLRIPAQAGYGFVTAKMQGADNLEAGVTAGLFGLFGMFNTKNLNRSYKNAAYFGARRALVDRMVAKGVPADRAVVVSDRFFQWAVNKAGGFQKTTIKDFDTFSKVMRKGWKIHIELDVGPNAPTQGPIVKPGLAIPAPKPARAGEMPKNIESRVVQVVNVDPNRPESFFIIPKGEIQAFHDAIDDTAKGIAGIPIQGKAWHISAVTTPEKMLKAGFKYGGVAKIEDIPTKFIEISKELKPFVKKAKKFKTAEEFMANIAKGETINLDDIVPTKALNILNKAFATVAVAEIPEEFYGKITLGELIAGFEKLGVGEEIIKESTIALKKAGYKKIGNIVLTDEGAVPEQQLIDIWNQVQIKPIEPKEAAAFTKQSLLDDLTAQVSNQAGFVNVDALAEPLQEALPTISKVADEFTRYRGLTSNVVEKFVAAEEAVPQIVKDSVDQANKLLGHLDPVTRKQLQYALEERTPVPKGTEELARQIRSIEEWALTERQSRGYFKKDLWPNNAIDALVQESAKLNTKIHKLEVTESKTLKGVGRDVENILDLQEQRDQILKRIDKLNRLKYLHRVTEPLKVAAKVRGRPGKAITKFPYNFVGRKFDTIRDAEAAGHVVGDLMESVAETIADTRVEALKDDLIKAINNNPNFSSKTFKSDWVEVDSRLMPAARGRFYHPVMGKAIKQLTYASDATYLVRIYDNINTFGKMIGFYNPLIMAKNDIAQGWRAAGIKFFGNIPKAISMHQNRDPQIALWERQGLYNNILDYKPAVSDMIRVLIDQASKTLPKRLLEQFMRALNPAQMLNNLMSVNNKTTWAMDRVLRTAARLGIENAPVSMNLSEFEITDKANDFLANYAKFPKRSRRIANRVIFTPTYRISMVRVLADMWKHPVQHREQLLRHYMYRMFFRFVLPWLASMYVMNRYGKEVNTWVEGHRLVIQDEKGEKVVAFSDPLLEQVKLTDRPLRTTLKFNMAFIPQFTMTWLNRGKFDYPKSDLERISEYFNIGAPGLRDYLNWRDQDKTNFEKWMTQFGIAYVYSREPSRHVEIERAVWYKLLDGLDAMPKWFENPEARERMNLSQAYSYYQSKLRKYEREFARTNDPEVLDKIELLEEEVMQRYGVPVRRKTFEEMIELQREIGQRDILTKEEYRLFKSPTWVKDVINLRKEQGENLP